MIAIPRLSGDPAAPVFEPGQLVIHRKYGYRGVVVERDDACQADEEWYQKNQTQPDRDQPWYHVLVDGTSTCTYAAAENLKSDPSNAAVSHPLLNLFFSAFDEGRYIRNSKPWLV